MAQQAYKPSSVPPTDVGAVTINLAPALPPGSSGQPEDRPGVPTSSYLALLRVGFAQPTGCPAAGGLLPHHFTLTPKDRGGVFLWHFPSGYPAWALPSTLPGGARTFLPDKVGAITQPTGPILL